MSIAYFLTDNLTPEYHQGYIKARQNAKMDYIENFDDWLCKIAELEKLKLKNQNDTWESSEYNPTNYPDFESLDDDTKQQRIAQGEQGYWTASTQLENQIRVLQAQLLHPDEIERIVDGNEEVTDQWIIE